LKKLDLYVLRELTVPFLIGTIAVVLMFQANLLIFQLKTFSISAVPIAATLQLILYNTPQYLNMTLPVGTALAASLAISRLTRESELTAMRSAGASILRVILPITAFGAIVGVGNYLIAERVMPKAQLEARKLMMQVGLLGALPEFKNNITVNLPKYSVNVGSVTRIDSRTLLLNRILLYERPDPDVTVFIQAESGEYRDGIWRLRDTFHWRFEGLNLIRAQPGKDVVINEKISFESIFAPPLPEEKTTEELKQAIREGARAGFDTTWLQEVYHSRFSVPAACVVFALAGAVFAAAFARGGGFVGVLVSIIIVFLYYNGFVISMEVLGKNGIVSPFLAAWLPNFAFLVLGAIGLRRLE